MVVESGITEKALKIVCVECFDIREKYKGGWTHFQCYLSALLVIAIFCLAFYVTLNSRNTKLKTMGFAGAC